ncbi:tape measure protein [Gordonia phage Austin]|nr:tape measure protein [Gordonia phage Austin]
MNSNVNILITAAANQARSTINSVQAQLRSLQAASATTRASSNGPWFNGLAPAQGRIASTQAQLRTLTGVTNTANAASNRPWFASMTASGSRLQWIGKQLTTNFTAPVLIASAVGVKFGLDMEKSMTRVRKVYGDGALAQKELSSGINITARETKALEKNFIALSDRFGVQADEVAGVAAEWAAAGSSGVALAKQTKLTMETMVLGEMEATEATKSLIAIQAQWGTDTEGLTHTLRQLNAVENETGTTLSDLVVGFSRASASARAAGLQTGELAAMIAALTPAAGSASEAGNSLKTVFARIMKPTADFTKVMGAMGIQTESSAWQSMNAGKRLKFLADSFKDLTAPQRAVVSSLAAGNWQVNRFQQLMEEMGKENGYYGKTLKLLADNDRVAAIAQNELNAVLESSPQRAKQAGTIIQNSLMKAMEPLIPVIIQLGLWFGKLFRSFSEIDPKIRTTVIALLLLLAVLGPMIVAAGILKLSIGQLAPIFMFLGRALLLPLAPLKLLRLSFWATAAQTVVGSRLMAVAVVTMQSMAAMLKGVALITVAAWKIVAIGAAASGKAALAAWRTAWAAMIIWQSVTGTVLTTRQMIVFTTMLAIQNLWAMASAAVMRVWSAVTIAAITLWARVSPAIFAVWSAVTTGIQKTWAAAWLAMQSVWRAASIMGQAAWAAASTLGFAAWKATTLALQRSWSLAWLAISFGWAAASTAITVAWSRAQPLLVLAAQASMLAIVRAGSAAILVVQKTWALAMLLMSASTWKGLIALSAGGMKGIFTMILRGGAMILGALASPWILAIGAVVGLLVVFRKQIAQAFNNIVAYFKNLPAETAKGLSPIANIFIKIKNVALRAFNALPNGIKSALLKVVAIVRAAALKVYELFSYINPFAHHSPSLVENVTNGMEVVNQQFTNSANHAKRTIGALHASIKTLQGLSKPVVDANTKADYDKVRSNANQAGVGNAMPAYDKLNAQVKAGTAQLTAMNRTIDAHEAKLKRIKSGVDQYDKALEKLNSELNVTKSIQEDVGRALDGAKARYDRYANAQIAGMGAAEDAAFANEQAQKRLQLQIAKMEQESGTIDSVSDSYSKLQGQIETLTAKQTDLRNAGAGSDILGTYDKMIADLKKQQSGLMSGGADSPAGKIAALNTQLQKLQNQANVMDLEKSLKFDSLNRNIDKFKNNVEELPYGELMNGLDSSRSSVNALQYSYDMLDSVMAGQNARIAQTQAQRDALQKVYDAENTKLEAVKQTYEEVEKAVRDGEQALTDFASAAEEAVRRQEEAASAAKSVGKKAKGGKGGSDAGGPGLDAFNDAAAGDFATFGGKDVIGREGGLDDQSLGIDELTKNITGDLETALGGLNPFEPLKNAWNKTMDWFRNLGAPISDVFGGIGSSISSAFNPGENENVSAFGGTLDKIKESGSKIWDSLKKVGDLIGGLFGPDLLTTVKELGAGFAEIWGKIADPLRELGGEILPFLKAAWEPLAVAIGAAIGVLEILWEVINGAIGPVFSWLGDIIAQIINVIKGAIKIITGVINVVMGVVKTIIGIIKGIFTGDWGQMIEGLKQIFVDGFGKIFGGIWDIVKSIFVAIWSTIKNFVKLIWNTVWGFVKGIIDFFYHLWDVLVGHSIVPDTINSIIDWFKSLPGKILSGLWTFIKTVIGFFAKLPMLILKGLLMLGQFLWRAFSSAFIWLVQNLPGVIVGLMTWVGGLVGNILGWLGDLGGKLLEWMGAAWQWLVDNGPTMLLNLMVWLTGIAGNILIWLGNLGGKLLEWMGAAWKWVVDNGPSMLASLVVWLVSIPGKIIGWLGDIGSKLGEWLKAGWDYLKDNWPTLLAKFIIWLDGINDWIIDKLKGLGGKLGEWIKSAWDWIVDNGPDLLGKFWNWIKGLPGKILEKLGDASKMLYDFGKNMIQGLLNGAGDLLSKIGEFMLDKLPSWIKTPFKKAMGIESPSKVFAGYGRNIGEGLIIGMDGMGKQVEGASHAMAAAADAGTVGGMSISAAADTSSVGGAVSELSAAANSTASKGAAIDVAATADVSADPGDVDYAAAQAALTAFITESTAQLTTFNATVTASINGMVLGITAGFTTMQTSATAAFTNMNTIAVTQFTAMQTNVVTIVSTMVTTVNGQLQLLITYVTSFGQSFNAAWNAAWKAWQDTTTSGVNNTLSEWERMALGLNNTLESGIRPVFDEMQVMLQELEDAYARTVDNVGATWDGIREKTAAPARFVINDVYNDGIRGAWNKFNKFLDLEELPEHTASFATGGSVHGKGTGTSDSIRAMLSNGEHVITAREVQAAGGHAAIENQRRAWLAGRNGSMQTGVEAFKNGGRVGTNGDNGPGLVQGGNIQLGDVSAGGITTPIQQAMWDAVRTAFPQVTLFSATRYQDVGSGYDYHMAGMALDVSPSPEIANWIYAMNKTNPVLELIHWPLAGWENLKNGAPLDYGAATNAGHMDHVHWAMNTMVDNEGKIVSMGPMGAGINPVNYKKLVEDGINSSLDAVLDRDPKFGGGIGEWVPKSIELARKSMQDKLGPLAEKHSLMFSGSKNSGPGGNIPYDFSAGVEQWRKLATEMLIKQGQSATYVDRLLMQMNSESGGNPNAINDWDINATNGTPSKGLMQVIDPTFQQWRDPSLPNDIWDPAANIAASIRYTMGRYGTLDAWNGTGYDSGGVLPPGFTLAHNQTGGPEAILTKAQWSAMFDIAKNGNLKPEDVQDAVTNANIATGNTADKQADAIIKGMDVWQKAWTPALYGAADESVKASDKVSKAADGSASATVALNKSLGAYSTQITALSKALVAFSNSAQSSVKVTVNVKTGATTTEGGSGNVTKNEKGETVVTVEQPTLEAWAPTINAFADLLDALPYADRNWDADNPVAGETERERKMRIAQNNMTNYTKGAFNVLKDMGPVVMRHTAIIGTAAERLLKEDGPAWTAAMTMIATGNPGGYALATLLAVKAVATLLPLVIAAIMDIVPALIRAIVRFLTQFMPDSVFAYADMAAAEDAVREQQEGGATAQGQGRRYPSDAMRTSNGNENINLYMYGDLVMPNVSDGSDADDFVTQLKLLAGK